LSTDQVAGSIDELEQLYSDPQMTNMISADRPFNLQIAELELAEPFMVMAATDGCFGYLPGPGHFEVTLLEELRNAVSLDDWAQRLTKAFNAVAGDDTSFAAMAFDHSFEAMRRGTAGWLAQLHDEQVAPVAKAADAEQRRAAVDHAWQLYRRRFTARRNEMHVGTVEGE